MRLIINSLLLGVALAMDAFSVSLANGLNEPNMKTKRAIGISSIFAGFQAIMPFIGWACVTTIVTLFSSLTRFIPWIALCLLLFIGIKMIIDGVRNDEEHSLALTIGALLIQGIATSIDALSVGFTIADYNIYEALLAVLIIGLVTFFICFVGVKIGQKFGTKMSGKATILGGIILIIIGIEIFITGIIG